MSDDIEFNNTENDELVVLKLPRSEVKVLRDMVRRQRAMSELWKWVTAFFLVFVSGLLTMVQFGDAIKRGLLSWLGG